VTPAEERLTVANQNLSFMLSAIIKAHGGWLVLTPDDMKKVSPKDNIIIQDGPRKHEILLKVL